MAFYSIYFVLIISASIGHIRPELTLSERLIDSGKDSFQELIASDYVQQLLMNGGISAEIKAIATRYFISMWNLIPEMNNAIEYQIDYAKLTDEEKSYLKDMKLDVMEYNGPFAVWDQEGYKLFGIIEESIRGQPMSAFDKNYTNLYWKIPGRAEDLLTAILPRLYIYSELRTYLQNNDDYIPNPVTDWFLLVSLDPDNKMAGEDMKLIDKRANSISAAQEEKLKKLYQKYMENEINWHLSIYAGAQ